MAFDGFVLRRIVQELQSFVGPPVEGVYLVGPNDVRIHMLKGKDLLLSCTPNAPRITTSKVASTPEGKPWHPKRLAGARIEHVQQEHQDRILALRFIRPDRLGGEAHSVLLLELTGRNANLILLERDSGLILEALRRVSAAMSQRRRILPGYAYLPPPKQDRIDPAQGDLEAFERRLASTAQPTVLDALVRTLPLASQAVARFVAHRAGVMPEANPADLDPCAIRRLHEAVVYLYALDLSASPPCLLLDEEGRPEDFSAVPPVWLPAGQVVPCKSMMDAVDRCFRTQLADAQAGDVRESLSKAIQRELASATKKVENLQLDLETAERAEECRIKGDILTANLSRVRRRQSAVELDNFYDPAGGKITIELDPKRTPAANAQRYFKLYRKAKDGRASIARQLEMARDRADRARAYEALLADSYTLEALQELRKQLARNHLLRAPAERRRRVRSEGEKRFSPRRYITSDGWTILVGRSDAENDVLTGRLAAQDDLWFHAQGCAGSHVILRREGRKGAPGKAAIEEAAGLAAFWSKARHSGSVAVNYTQVRHVSKPKGSKPGLAAFRSEKTVFVEPKLIAQAEERERDKNGASPVSSP